MYKQYYVTPKGTLASRLLADCADVEKASQYYLDHGGEVHDLVPGSLCYGLRVLTCEGRPTVVFREIYLNPWQSAHTVRMYKITPKKYVKAIEESEVA